MIKIADTIEKKMQIRFSKIYTYQENKTNLESEIDLGTETSNVIDNVRNLSVNTPLDCKKMDLYAHFYGLGKIEYGEKGLQYINEILPNNIPKITESEIVHNNLQTIFPDYESAIGDEVFQEFKQIYENEKDSEEINLIKLAILLEKLSQGVSKTLLEDGNDKDYLLGGIKIKLEEIKKIRSEYETTHQFKPTKRMEKLLPQIEKLYANYQLSESQKEEIETMLEEIILKAKTRKELLDGIYAFRTNKKKIRGK